MDWLDESLWKMPKVLPPLSVRYVELLKHWCRSYDGPDKFVLGMRKALEHGHALRPDQLHKLGRRWREVVESAEAA